MDETLSLIIHGCKLARVLESNLPNLSSQPNILSDSCDAIASVFKSAIDRLNSNNPSSSSYPPMHESMEPRPSDLEVAMQEWLKSSYIHAVLGSETPPTMSDVKTLKLDGKNIEYSMGSSGSTCSRSGREIHISKRTEFSKSSVDQKIRKRKDGVDARIERVPVPRIGNTEIPPEDGFTWRKYGQKEILGSIFPRSYYRCTHKNLGCMVKKYVQRLDEDHNMYEITYYGNHTCHVLSTTPSAPRSADAEPYRLGSLLLPPPPPPPPPPQPQPPQPPLSTSLPLSIWLPIGLEATGEKDANASVDLHLQTHPTFNLGGNESNMVVEGTSQVRDTRENDCPVVEFADAMFNSGSSSSDMDSIFPSMQEK